MTILDLPEIDRLSGGGAVVRLPPGVDVPVTPRVRRLIDSAPFRRLASISQLGLVSLVYPAANHTRHEHSLGVYLASLEFLRSLATDERFVEALRPGDAELVIAAALLHDIGHWPYCHPIEDLRLPEAPDHERLAGAFLLEGEIADALRSDWGVEPNDVVALLAGDLRGPRGRVLSSVLSGPIDVDKIDYLTRDSLHAGVPYGQQFDRSRLVRGLCLNEAGDGVAISEKAKTAAEMMVFARYVMFSEVYWHHAVRSATAMLQRAYFTLRADLDAAVLQRSVDAEFRATLAAAAAGGPAAGLVDGLFGSRRVLYKRLAQCSVFESPRLYTRLARRPYEWLVRCAGATAERLAAALGRDVDSHDVLFDAPPAQLEVEFDVDVFSPHDSSFRRLGEVSPMVRALAREQFDDHVKRVRVFVHPRLAADARALPDVGKLLDEAVDDAG